MPQQIACPRCFKTELFSPSECGYVDRFNMLAKLYRCEHCKLIFFIQVPSREDGWRLLPDTRISSFGENKTDLIIEMKAHVDMTEAVRALKLAIGGDYTYEGQVCTISLFVEPPINPEMITQVFERFVKKAYFKKEKNHGTD